MEKIIGSLSRKSYVAIIDPTTVTYFTKPSLCSRLSPPGLVILRNMRPTMSSEVLD